MSDNCDLCNGKGFVEVETGVVSPHIPFEKEKILELCACAPDPTEST